MLRHLYESYGRSPYIWLGILLTAGSHVIFKIAAPIVMTSWIIGLVYSQTHPLDDLWRLAALYAAAMLLGMIGDYVFIRHSDGRYEYLVGRFHDRITAKPIDYFRRAMSGGLSTLFRNHLDGTINVFRLIRVDIIPLLIATVGPIIVLATRDFWVATFFATGVLLRGYLTWHASKRLKVLRKAALKVYRELSGVMSDQMAQMTLVRASARVFLSRAKVVRLATEEGRLFWIRHRAAVGYDLVGNILTAGCFIGTLGAVAVSGLNPDVQVQVAILSMIFIVQALQAVSVVVELHQRWSERWEHAASSLEELSDGARRSAVEVTGSRPLATGEVEFRGVRFAYPSAHPSKAIFDNVDVAIPDGRHVAVMGKNGAGKSTLVNLVFRFDDVIDGEVRIGGRNLSAYSDEDLYSSLSYVPQDPRLFNGTLRENLYFFEPDAPAERSTQVFEMLGIDALVRELPGGLEAAVGELGATLSGGQRQKVAIARALLRDARIYVFDEPTSAIHGKDAREIIPRLRSFLEGRTVLLITHSEEISHNFQDILEVADRSIRWVQQSN